MFFLGVWIFFLCFFFFQQVLGFHEVGFKEKKGVFRGVEIDKGKEFGFLLRKAFLNKRLGYFSQKKWRRGI